MLILKKNSVEVFSLGKIINIISVKFKYRVIGYRSVQE